MSEYITLLGAEQVQSAGCSMRDAGVRMQSAASSIEDSIQRHERFLDDWLTRFEIVVDKLKGEADP